MARIIVLAIALLNFVPASQPTPPGRVTIHLSVLDAKGGPVTDLQAADFEIRDKGKLRPVEVFTTDVPVRSVIVLLDISGSMTPWFDALPAAAAAVLTDLPPTDRVRLGAFAVRLQLGPVISGNRLDALQTFRSALNLDGPAPSALYDAVISSLETLAGDVGRRVVVLLTDGGDSSSRRRPSDVLERAQALDAAIFVLAFPERRDISPSPGTDLRIQVRDATETGGGYVEWKGGNLNEATARLIGQLRAEYRLEFTPADIDGKRHALDVVVKKQGVRVFVRRRFIAPTR